MSDIVAKLKVQIEANTEKLTSAVNEAAKTLDLANKTATQSFKGVQQSLITGSGESIHFIARQAEELQAQFRIAIDKLRETRKQAHMLAVSYAKAPETVEQRYKNIENQYRLAISEGDYKKAIEFATLLQKRIIDTAGPVGKLYYSQMLLNDAYGMQALQIQKIGSSFDNLSPKMISALRENLKYSLSLADSAMKAGEFSTAIAILQETIKRSRLPVLDDLGFAKTTAEGELVTADTRLTTEARQKLDDALRANAKSHASIIALEAEELVSKKDLAGATAKFNEALAVQNLSFKDQEQIIRKLLRVNEKAGQAKLQEQKDLARANYERFQYLKTQKEFQEAEAMLTNDMLDSFAVIRKKSAAERDLVDIKRSLASQNVIEAAKTRSVSDALEVYTDNIKTALFTTKQLEKIQKDFSAEIIKTSIARADEISRTGDYASALRILDDAMSQLEGAQLKPLIPEVQLKGFEKSRQMYLGSDLAGTLEGLITRTDETLSRIRKKSIKTAVAEARASIDSVFAVVDKSNAEAVSNLAKLTKTQRDRIIAYYNNIEERYAQLQRNNGAELARSLAAQARGMVLQGDSAGAIELMQKKLAKLQSVLGKSSSEFQRFNSQLEALKSKNVNQIFGEFLSEARADLAARSFTSANQAVLDAQELLINNLNRIDDYDRKRLETFKLRSKILTESTISELEAITKAQVLDVSKITLANRIFEGFKAASKDLDIIIQPEDLKRVEKVYSDYDKRLRALVKDRYDEELKLAKASAESNVLKQNFSEAIAILQAFGKEVGDVYGEASAKFIEVANAIERIKKKQAEFQDAQFDVELKGAKDLADFAKKTPSAALAANKYSDAIDKIEEALGKYVISAGKAAEAQKELTKIKMAAADREVEDAIRVAKETALAGDPAVALEALQQLYKEKVTPAIEFGSFQAEIDRLNKVIPELESQLNRAKDELNQLAAEGKQSTEEFQKARDAFNGLAQQLTDANARMNKAEQGIKDLGNAAVISNEMVKKLGNEVSQMSRRAGAAWKRFNIDPTQITQAFIGASIGAYSLYDAIENTGQMIKQFVIDSVNMANQLQRTQFSASLVTKDLETFNKISNIAKDNQRLFGGTLNDNIKELTGFTLVARTAGVDLKSLVSVSQRLATFDPGQGISGASIALREFLAGNIRSLRERFELPANILKELGNTALTAQQKLDLFSRFLDEQGLSMEAIGGQLDLTQQAYRDFGIAWEETTLNIGRDVAETFAGVTRAFGSLLNTFNKTAYSAENRARAVLTGLPQLAKAIGNVAINAATAGSTASIDFVDILQKGLIRVTSLATGIDFVQIEKDIAFILKNVPEAELRIQPVMQSLQETKDYKKFQEDIAILKKEAQTFLDADAARDFVGNAAKVAEDTNAPYAQLVQRIFEISQRSHEAAIASKSLIQQFQQGQFDTEELTYRVESLNFRYSSLISSSRFIQEARELEQKQLETYTEAYANLILTIEQLNNLNMEDGLYTQAESAALLTYTLGEIQKARNDAIGDQYKDLLNQAADAMVAMNNATSQAERDAAESILTRLKPLIMTLTGLSEADLQTVIDGWIGVRVAQAEASRENFEYSRSAIEAKSAAAQLAAGTYLAQNAFKEYQRTGAITDEVMTQLLQITDETGQKIYQNEGAVYAAADAYIKWQGVLSRTGQGLHELSLESINLQIAEVNRQIAQQKGVAAFEEYANTQKISASGMQELLQLTDEHGQKLYENEEAVYAAAEAHKELIDRKKELERLEGKVTEATDEASNAQKLYTGQALLARIEAEKLNATNKLAEAILNDLADGAVLTAQKQAFLQVVLGNSGTSVSRLIALWEDLIIVQTAGSLIDTDPMINQLRRAGAGLVEIKKYIEGAYDLEGFFGLGGDSGGGGDAINSVEDFFKEMKSIAEDYHKDVLDAEREYQQDLLDIQEEFQDKQLKSLKESEIHKREVRPDFYRELIDSGLPLESQQKYSAQFETGFQRYMDLASSGQAALGKEFFDTLLQNLSENMASEKEILKAIEEGDTKRVEVLQNLDRLDRLAQDERMKQLFERGDPNIAERDQAIDEANQNLADKLTDINIKTADRAKTLLETEPEIAKKLSETNSQYSDMLKFITDLSNYVDPLQKGYDDATVSANNLLIKTKELIDYLRNNPVGVAFVGGVAQGVQAGTPGAVQAAEDSANQMVDGAKDTLEARSPSRRTFREIGVPFAQGMLKGIQSYTNKVRAGARTLVDAAVQSSSDAIPVPKNQKNIDAFKQITETSISILEGMRSLLPDTKGAAQGRAYYAAEVGRIEQDAEAQMIARREKLAKDLLLARTDQERQILTAVADQDLALLQQQANIQKAAQQEELRKAVDQEKINAAMEEIRLDAAEQMRHLEYWTGIRAQTDPERAARLYQMRSQQILQMANLRQELERYLLENNLTTDDAYASLLRQQIQQTQYLNQMENLGTNVSNGVINSAVYNINLDLRGTNLNESQVRNIVKQELTRATSLAQGSTG